MKKIIALALSLILVLSLSVTAFAATIDNEEVTSDAGIAKGTYDAVVEAADVYSVNVEWAGLTSFVYKDTDEGSWNPGTHEYDNTVPAHWEGEATVTVTNHSNVDVTVDVAVAAEDGFAFNKANDADYILDAGAEGDVDGADKLTVTITAADNCGPLTDANAEEPADLATITITIDKYVPAT